MTLRVLIPLAGLPLFASLLLLTSPAPAGEPAPEGVKAPAAEKAFPPPGSRRVLFLGDSITFAGHYVAMIDARLIQAHGKRHWQIVNLGLPSETCSGLSEPDHPYPRPNVHERLDRALSKFKPDVVVACYGMNDGIYYPFSDQRFAAYQKGIDAIISKVKAAGAKLVLMTPPPFDPLPLKKKGKLRAADADTFAWFAIYENYDDVLTRYADWIIGQSNRVEMVIDLHTPVARYVANRRKQEPDFTMSPDGVHLNRGGHALIAKAILKAWGYKAPANDDEKLLKVVEQRELLLRNAWLSHVGHKRPGVKAGLALDEANAKAAELDRQIDAIVEGARPLER